MIIALLRPETNQFVTATIKRPGGAALYRA